MKRKSPVRYKIYFALGGAHVKRKIKGPANILIPSTDKWNDFSYRTLFSYVIDDFPETVSGELLARRWASRPSAGVSNGPVVRVGL
jgi:hypothetical protein